MKIEDNYFKELVDSGIDFINRAISELDKSEQSPEGLKYSTIHLYQGIELLLKSILVKEHWTLIISNVGKSNYEQYKKGDFHSVGYEEIIGRLQNCCRIKIDKGLDSAFNEIRKLRNKYIHFHCKEPVPSILNTQYKAWHYSFILVKQEKLLFDESMLKRLRNVEKGMLKNKKFIDARYKEVESKRNKLEKRGTVLYRCPWCETESMYFDADNVEWKCLVCNDEYDPNDLSQKLYDVEYHPKHNPDFMLGNCKECECESVVPITCLGGAEDDVYLCLNCYTEWARQDKDTCEKCGRLFFGMAMEGGTCDDCFEDLLNDKD